MNKVKYKYDYPENREIAKGLEHGDIMKIKKRLVYSYTYIRLVLKGKRKNKEIIELANKIAEWNKRSKPV